MPEQGTLYVVATPIGNLQDLSPRAREILATVNAVICEDTRVTSTLLKRMQVDTRTLSIHQHSSDSEIQNIIDTIRAGDDLAYVSDAGTPNISDPGGKLVARAADAGINVVPIPGPSAILAALSVCGFPADRFLFLGFPPHKKGRNSYFEEIAMREETIVLFESKHRIEKTLSQLPQDRLMMIGRELTKLHETIYRGTAPEILDQLQSESTKGEFVIVLAPKKWK